jgi:hypothetical protein
LNAVRVADLLGKGDGRLLVGLVAGADEAAGDVAQEVLI